MKSWQELLLLLLLMTLAVAQPRFSTKHPDTRAGSILSRRCPCLAIHFCPANASVSVIIEIWGMCKTVSVMQRWERRSHGEKAEVLPGRDWIWGRTGFYLMFSQ